MSEFSGQDTNIFHGTQWEPLFGLVVYFACFLLILKNFDSGDIQSLKNLFTGNFKGIPEDSWVILVIIIFMFMCLLYMILVYIANKRSYIELTSTILIINKPLHYPSINMDTLYIPYEEIDNIKIVPVKIGWKVVITKKDGFGNEKIRFFGLNHGKKFGEELKKKGIQSYIYYDGWDTPPDA